MFKKATSTEHSSFHFDEIKTSVNRLVELFGEPDDDSNTGDDKVNFEWEMENEDGDKFTVYDWKEYRRIKLDETISWHIGAKDEGISRKIRRQLEQVI